jgi:ribonuclease HII
MNDRFAYDAALAGKALVAGADEAGRGCLAGPLVAAAVCFDLAALAGEDYAALAALDDSKKLTRRTREALYDEILRRARQVVLVSCSPATIDAVGLHRCNIALLGRAAEALRPRPAVVLVDGFVLPGCACEHRQVVGGDGLSASIAAASVIAKVTRDRVMARLHDAYPQYGFDRHVGYATAAHQEAIVEHGVCVLHRLSFASVAYQQLGLGLEPAPDSGLKAALGCELEGDVR